jgi:hypothetical protein
MAEANPPGRSAAQFVARAGIVIKTHERAGEFKEVRKSERN